MIDEKIYDRALVLKNTYPQLKYLNRIKTDIDPDDLLLRLSIDKSGNLYSNTGLKDVVYSFNLEKNLYNSKMIKTDKLNVDVKRGFTFSLDDKESTMVISGHLENRILLYSLKNRSLMKEVDLEGIKKPICITSAILADGILYFANEEYDEDVLRGPPDNDIRIKYGFCLLHKKHDNYVELISKYKLGPHVVRLIINGENLIAFSRLKNSIYSIRNSEVFPLKRALNHLKVIMDVCSYHHSLFLTCMTKGNKKGLAKIDMDDNYETFYQLDDVGHPSGVGIYQDYLVIADMNDANFVIYKIDHKGPR